MNQAKRTKKTAAPEITRDEMIAMLVSYGIDADEAEGWMGVAQDFCPKDDEEAARHWVRCTEWVRCATQEIMSNRVEDAEYAKVAL